MIARTISVCARNEFPVPANVVAIPNATPTDVFKDSYSDQGEISYRGIQNVGANNIYYAFGQDCTALAYHGVLTPNSAVPCPSRCRVSVYCPTATSSVATTQFNRAELG